MLFYVSSGLTPSVSLGPGGSGSITFPLNKSRFVAFGTSDSIFFTLLMDPGYDLRITLDNGISKIEGNGAAANNYLLKAKPLVDSMISATNEYSDRNKKPDEFLGVMQAFEKQFDDLHQQYTSGAGLAPHISYLLKNALKAEQLVIRQRFLLRLKKSTIDSLGLENKLGISSHGLFKDTLLIRSGHVNFRNFLIFNCDYAIGDSIYDRYPDREAYPVLVFSEIHQSKRYSADIAEYLLYCSLTFDTDVFGPGPVLENLHHVFYTLYPSSPYAASLKKNGLKYQSLAEGRPAIYFKGLTPSGGSFSLGDYKGKLVLIDVWATWCGPCREELPATHKLQQEFLKSKDLAVIYLSVDSDTKAWRSYLDKNKWLTGIHVNTRDATFLEGYKISGIPRYILIGKDGTIINAFCDNPSGGTIGPLIRKALSNGVE